MDGGSSSHQLVTSNTDTPSDLIRTSIVRHIPTWFPGAYFQRYAKKVRQELDEWVTKPWELVKTSQVIFHYQSFVLKKLMPMFEGYAAIIC
jgi:hypothetical protein